MASLPPMCRVRFPLSSQQRDASLIPSLCSLLASPPANVLFATWFDHQYLGTYHTVELASHLIGFTTLNPPSLTLACEIYQSYCTNESPFPVACEVRQSTLEQLFNILDAGQQAAAALAQTLMATATTPSSSNSTSLPLSPPQPQPLPIAPLAWNTFDTLLDELLYYLLPHFNLYLHSSDFTYSMIERILLSPNNEGHRELFFSICKSKYVEEFPLFILDFHGFVHNLHTLPPKLLPGLKRYELDRNSKFGGSPTSQLQTTIEDGYIMQDKDNYWILSVKHQRIIDGNLKVGALKSQDSQQPNPFDDLTALPPRPSLPSFHSSTKAFNEPPTMVHIPAFVQARLAEIQLLYEKYLQPSSSAQKHMLHAALMALHPNLQSASLSLKSGNQMSQPHPLARRAEFALRELPYYLLRNFLDHFHLCCKYNFIGSELLESLFSIQLWCVRDMELRKGLLTTFYEQVHFGEGRKLGLSHGLRANPYAGLTEIFFGRFDSPKDIILAGIVNMQAQEGDAFSVNSAANSLDSSSTVPASACITAASSSSESQHNDVHHAFSIQFLHRPQHRRARSESELGPLGDYWMSLPWHQLEAHMMQEPTSPNSTSVSSASTSPSSKSANHEKLAQKFNSSSIFSSISPQYIESRSSGGVLSGFIPVKCPKSIVHDDFTRPISCTPPSSPPISRPSSSQSMNSQTSNISTSGGVISSNSSPDAALLPALPFLPPSRSFHFATVTLYRKHVLGVSKRQQKEEEEKSNTTASSSSGSINPNNNVLSSPSSFKKPVAIGARQTSTSISSHNVQQNILSRSSSATPLSFNKKPRTSVDELEWFCLEKVHGYAAQYHHLPPPHPAGRDHGYDQYDATAKLRKQQLYEQIQSMRHINGEHDQLVLSPKSNTRHLSPIIVPSNQTSENGAIISINSFDDQLHSRSCPPSPGPLKGASSSGTPRSAAISSMTPRSRAVRFSAYQRHEVREFDADAEPSNFASPPSSVASAISFSPSNDTPSSAAGGRNHARSATQPNVATPGVHKRRLSILKHQSSGPLMEESHSPPLDSKQGGNGTFSLSPPTSIHPGSTGTATLPPSPLLGFTPSTLLTSSATSSPLRPLSYSDAMRRIYDSRQSETNRLLTILGKGAVFLKFQATSAATQITSNEKTSFAKSDYRYFYINAEASELSWCKLVNTTKQTDQTFMIGNQRKKPQKENVFHKHKTKLLADGLRLFPDSSHSPYFTLYNNSNQPPWLCLTLLFTDRSIDLVAMNEEQAEDWFFGLQALIPLNPSFKSKSLYLWNKLRLKVQFYAKQKSLTVAVYCRILINQARIQEDAIQKFRFHHSSPLPPPAITATTTHTTTTTASTPDEDENSTHDDPSNSVGPNPPILPLAHSSATSVTSPLARRRSPTPIVTTTATTTNQPNSVPCTPVDRVAAALQSNIQDLEVPSPPARLDRRSEENDPTATNDDTRRGSIDSV